MNMQIVPACALTSPAVEPASDSQFDLFGAPINGAGKAAPAKQVDRNYYATGYRVLPKTWQGRAAANNACIQLASKIVGDDRHATREEQAALMLFTSYGASDLANGCFRDPSTGEYRQGGWADIATTLESITSSEQLTSLKRSTQYAHFTPERIIRHIWRAVTRLGFSGGRVLEPGMGTGLFLSHLPAALRDKTSFHGIEADPVTAQIAGLLYPNAKIQKADFADIRLRPNYSLVIGNPPFSSVVVRRDFDYRNDGLVLHDYFIVKSLNALRDGAIGAFVTSQGTMNKASTRVRETIASSCDLVGAIRLPEGTFAEESGTSVGVDILFFRRRIEDEASNGIKWTQTISSEERGQESVAINEYFVDHPEMVLGLHAIGKGRYGAAPVYACKPIPGRNLDADIDGAIRRLPALIASSDPDTILEDDEGLDLAIVSGNNERLREGSFFVGPEGELCQVNDGIVELVAVKKNRGDTGIFQKHAGIIRALIPIRDTVRTILTAQERGHETGQEQKHLNELYDQFVAKHGPINRTDITTNENPETGERSETHRYPNLAPFRDDPDCWLVASIENYNIETNEAAKGPIFTTTVIGREVEQVINSPTDALALCLHTRGRVDIPYICDLLDSPEPDVISNLGDAVYHDPTIMEWVTADEYLSGKVRDKLQAAIAAASTNPAFARNVEALEQHQPVDIPPSDITARLGSPWVPATDIADFLRETLSVKTQVYHQPKLATWSVQEYKFYGTPATKAQWATHRYSLYDLVTDALNARSPVINDQVTDADGKTRSVINSTETEAAKEKNVAFRAAFADWIWTDGDRASRLTRIYNDTYNNLVARKFDGSHLTLPGANQTFKFYEHQTNVIWRQISAGSTYIAHAVGAGKTTSFAAGIMEQKRLGLVKKPVLAVPGHCLAQIAREFLALYPNAKILVADEQNFARDKRRRFLARAATGDWDAIVITHSAFKFIPIPREFEIEFLQTQLDEYEELLNDVDSEDRLSRKKIERQKEGFANRIEALSSAQDDFLTMSEIGIDQIYVDEAQEFRKLSFSTQQGNLKGVDPNGSQMAWDLFCKAAFVRAERQRLYPGAHVDRALMLASGTPITNTIGEMFTIQRFMDRDALIERDLGEFDAWANTFGSTRTELELQPSGKYKPVTRFAEFVNVPELIMMFRSFADVVSHDDLKRHVKLPVLNTGGRQIVTAAASPTFRAYQKDLAARTSLIEKRTGQVKKGDDILLSVITDGRHAAIDMRLVIPWSGNEPENKLNDLIRNVLRINRESSDVTYLQPDGTPYATPGGTQMIFSDLGTLAAEKNRGFSAYRWIKDQLIAGGMAPDQVAIVHDFNGMQAKGRLFADMRSGKVRVTIGSTKKMGTGVNAQNRLRALHHLDVPWIPSDIEQREGRIARQGNQNEFIDIYAYVTQGSMDATMWQTNERKARFIMAAMSGDRSVRRVEDVGADAINQFAMAKAIASGDPRLMQRSGLDAEISRLNRLRDAHFNNQHAMRMRIARAERDIAGSMQASEILLADIALRGPRDKHPEITVRGQTHSEPKELGRLLKALMTEVDTGSIGRRGERLTRKIATIGEFRVEYTARFVIKELHTDAFLVSPNRDYELNIWSRTPGAVAVEHIQQALNRLEDLLEIEHSSIAHNKQLVLQSSSATDLPFPYEQELALKNEELDDIDASLAIDKDDEQDPDPADAKSPPANENQFGEPVTAGVIQAAHIAARHSHQAMAA